MRSVYKKYQATQEINEITVPVEVTVFVTTEDQPVMGSDFDFGSEDENLTYLRRFVRGQLVSLCIELEVRALGLMGVSSLGQVHVRTQAMSYEQDIDNAITSNELDLEAGQDLAFNVEHQAGILARFVKPLRPFFVNMSGRNQAG